MPLNARRGSARAVVVLVLVVVLAAAAGLAYVLTRPPGSRPEVTTTSPSTAPATAPATQATTAPPKPKPPTTQYLDVVRDHHPRMPHTQPFAVPVDLSQAARLVLDEPVYLSSRQDLWITRPDAPPTESVLARAAREQHDQLTLAVRDLVVFAHWMPRDVGPWTFTLVTRTPGGKYEVVTQAGRRPIPFDRNYRWDRALDWNEQVIVPTGTGVSVMRLDPEVTEQHHDFAEPGKPAPENFSQPQFLLDWEGVLAWAPWERGKVGGRGAARFVEGKWTPLGPEQGWPERLLHLMPLFDGSVLQLVAREEQDDWVRVALATLDEVKVDEAQVARLVDELADEDEKVRQNAFNALTQFGPGLWPVLEKLLPDAEPEAQARIRQLLKSKVEPQLGGMTILGDQLRLASRLSDGGAVFFAELGVALPSDTTDVPVLRAPAWLAVRPGQAVQLLDPPLTDDMHPDRSRVYAFGADWVVTNDARGPQRFVGNGFVPLLRKAELAQGFMEPVGIDRRGRWLFRKAQQGDAGAAALAATPAPATAPAAATTPSTASATTTASTSPATTAATTGAAPQPGPGATLILDPTLPDPTPRLPVWVYQTAETVGWDASDWPAVKRGGSWALQDSGWRPMKRTDKMFTKPEEVPPVVPAAAAGAGGAGATGGTPTSGPTTAAGASATGPATAAATGPATTTSTAPAEDLGPPLLIDSDGNRYHNGRTELIVISPGGRRTRWPLPPAATGAESGQVFLVRTNDGLLFLFNRPGRVLRIRPTPDEAEPFDLEATFTRNIPNADPVTRVWLDPAGRIIMAYGNKLAIMFPQGYVPPAIAKLLPGGQLESEEP